MNGEKKSIKNKFIKILLIIIMIVLIMFGLIRRNNISEKISSNNLNENTIITDNNNNSSVFTDEQVRVTLSNYLELLANENCDNLLQWLNENGKLNYDSSKNTILNDGTVITSIRFSDYKNAMLNYVSENEFERNWNLTLYFNENSDGYLTKLQGGGAYCPYTIESITHNDDLNYIAKTYYSNSYDYPITKYYKDFSFEIKSYDGNCVIDSIKEVL